VANAKYRFTDIDILFKKSILYKTNKKCRFFLVKIMSDVINIYKIMTANYNLQSLKNRYVDRYLWKRYPVKMDHEEVFILILCF
jgi:hypothetical protein